MKKILVVDDSALMRKKLTQIIANEGKYDIQTSRDGEDALERIKEWDPDLVTLDINMPVMDGITCLSLIKEISDIPVIMVSSLTEKGALTTFEAMELGAFDYVTKPGGTVSLNVDTVAADLMAKIDAALKSRRTLFRKKTIQQPAPQPPSKPIRPFSVRKGVVLIGVSTGGPSTVEEILTQLPRDFPLPIIIAQHMPHHFTRVYAERLNSICQLSVLHVDQPTEIKPHTVYLAKGDADISVVKRREKIMVIPTPEGKHLWHPSVEKLVETAQEQFPPQDIIAVMLTGMGNDGAAQMAQVKKQGGRTIAESEETAVVFGMPRELIELEGATRVLPRNKIAQQIISWAQ